MKILVLLAVPAVALAAASVSAHDARSLMTPPPATHRVRMLQQGARYRFEPAGLRVRPGDVVEFVNISGGPHNVVFYTNRIPAGAEAALNAAMPNRLGNLTGKMLTTPNEVYRVSFAGAPEGTYDLYCLPHQALGMKATIIVGQAGGPGSTINDGEPTPDQVRP